MMLTLFLVGLFVFVLLGIPIALCLFLTAMVLMISTGDFSPYNLTQSLMTGMDNFPLLAVPFFMLAGELMNIGGISNRIVGFARSLVGHITGGLGYAAVVSSMIFAGVSGSAVADTSAVGSILLPMMKEDKYKVNESAALIGAAGTIGPVIPPSIPMILFGVAGGVSIAKLFMGGIIPGIGIGLSLMALWYFMAKKAGYKATSKFSMKNVITSFKETSLALLLPVIIIGGIIGGIATATETAVFAVMFAFVVGKFIYKELKWSHIPHILVKASKDTAIVMFVAGSASVAAYYITIAEIPLLLSNALLTVSDNPVVIMMLINVLLIIVGAIMDITPAILLLTPILLPIVTRLGISPVYFGVIMVTNLCIGLITPPVGTVLYVACGLAKLSLSDLIKPVLPMAAVMYAVLFIMTLFPDLVMFFPNMLK